MMYDESFVVAVDFDGTIAKGSTYGSTGTLDPEAKDVLGRLRRLGCTLVLWTCREGEDLEEAKRLLREWGVEMDYFNEYPLRNGAPKVNADFYIDDKALPGAIDWERTYDYIREMKEWRHSRTSRG